MALLHLPGHLLFDLPGAGGRRAAAAPGKAAEGACWRRRELGGRRRAASGAGSTGRHSGSMRSARRRRRRRAAAPLRATLLRRFCLARIIDADAARYSACSMNVTPRGRGAAAGAPTWATAHAAGWRVVLTPHYPGVEFSACMDVPPRWAGVETFSSLLVRGRLVHFSVSATHARDGCGKERREGRAPWRKVACWHVLTLPP